MKETAGEEISKILSIQRSPITNYNQSNSLLKDVGMLKENRKVVNEAGDNSTSIRKFVGEVASPSLKDEKECLAPKRKKQKSDKTQSFGKFYIIIEGSRRPSTGKKSFPECGSHSRGQGCSIREVFKPPNETLDRNQEIDSVNGNHQSRLQSCSDGRLKGKFTIRKFLRSSANKIYLQILYKSEANPHVLSLLKIPDKFRIPKVVRSDRFYPIMSVF